jgi:hypothetical protein
VRLVRYALVAALAASSIATPALAQGGHAQQISGAPVASQAAVGVRRSVNAPTPAGAPAGAPAPFRQDTRQNRAMMYVGGAALLTGLIIGGSPGALISVGGAVVGLWGLYQFLQ